MQEKTTKFKHKKSLGQHFLNNARVPVLMADAGEVGKDDVVLEIGPGTGALTRELLGRGATVIAIEADVRAISSLEETFASEIIAKKLVILHSDIREVDLSSLNLVPHSYKVVANIPYYISGLLFRFFLENDIQPSVLVFLVQKEVAERIARDKKESLLSLSVKIFGEPRYVKTVGKGNFTPSPKIDSAVIAISNISNKRLGTISKELFFKVLHEGFKSKRKQLIGNLLALFPKTLLTQVFSTLNLKLDIRGEDVVLTDWIKLVDNLSTHK